MERDELLIRLDERVGTVLITTQKQERHLAELNGRTTDSHVMANKNSNRLDVLENIAANGFQLKLNRKQVAVGGGGFAGAAIMMIVAFGKSIGWW